jgi:hypothetical protein|tara:strand:+ start:5471 stop:5593 length:123 start_codon:yes stop_codon:yes gene_type:complete
MFRSKRKPFKKPLDSKCCPKGMLGDLMKTRKPVRKPLFKK